MTGNDLRRELDDVRASRARIAAAADAERRRIERALHDGVQQDLIALAVNLELARELGHAGSYLEAASRDVHDALDGVRALAEGIYPPLLIDRGLAEALRGAARTARVPTRVEAPGDRYSPEVEAAVYFSCVGVLEALDPPSRAVVCIRPDGQSLLFEVQAEGGGIDASVLAEVGDRVGAFGGSLSVSPTSLFGTIPAPRQGYGPSVR